MIKIKKSDITEDNLDALHKQASKAILSLELQLLIRISIEIVMKALYDEANNHATNQFPLEILETIGIQIED